MVNLYVMSYSEMSSSVCGGTYRANVALHHSVVKQTSTTWKRVSRDGGDGNRREPPTFTPRCSDVGFHLKNTHTDPRLFTVLLLLLLLHTDSPRLAESVSAAAVEDNNGCKGGGGRALEISSPK